MERYLTITIWLICEIEQPHKILQLINGRLNIMIFHAQYKIVQ